MGERIDLCSWSVHSRSPKWSMRGRAQSEGKAGDGGKGVAPGPGQYNLVSPDLDKYDRGAKYQFGSGSRYKDGWGKMPGPGAYSPFDPSLTAPKWVFGSSNRSEIGGRAGSGPGPGHYETAGKLTDGMQKSFSGRFPGSRRVGTPGPGAYTPGMNPALESMPKYGFGSSNRSHLGTNNAPGPGTYEMKTALCQSAITKSAPCFSMKPRRPVVRNDATPGPGRPHTQFM